MGTPLSRPMHSTRGYLPFPGQNNVSSVEKLLRVRPQPRHLLYAGVSLFAAWALFSIWAVTDADSSYHHTGTWKPATDNATWPGRADAVKAAFVHAYHGWERWAAPADELLPLSEESKDK